MAFELAPLYCYYITDYLLPFINHLLNVSKLICSCFERREKDHYKLGVGRGVLSL